MSNTTKVEQPDKLEQLIRNSINHLSFSYAELDHLLGIITDAYNSGTEFTQEQLLVAERIDQFFLYYPEQSVFTEKLAEQDA